MSRQLPSRAYVGWAGIISLFSGSIALLATLNLMRQQKKSNVVDLMMQPDIAE